MSGRYDDIINLPHHQSAKHPRMTMTERAAQFSPFAALTGYGAVIAETGRLTDSRIELTDEQKDEIDRRLNELLQSGEPASFTYFIPDGKKDGGRVVTVTGSVQRLDPIEGIIVFESGEKIPVREILGIGEGSGAEGTE